MKSNNVVLVVCAHPDDETLGLGGTLALHALNGSKVSVLIFTDGQFGRDMTSKGIEMRKQQSRKACKILGIRNVKFLDYKDQKLDTISISELSCQIESEIAKLKPSIVYTHYWGDVNQDHRRIFEATLIALRPTPSATVKRFICFETPSSTEWGNEHFKPNLFVNIEKTLNKKVSAVIQYKAEINPAPHPRSKNSIINRSKYWGSSVGIKYAEAFLSVREII